MYTHTTDDVGDDESHWQDRVSSGFDRLVAFASTELTKTRRSIEEGGAPPSTHSRNTSPDSGINQSSSSDSRAFLSSSSSSSQIDQLPPIAMGCGSTQNTVPLIKSSPADIGDSPPPFFDAGLPRTPSPSASPSLMYGSVGDVDAIGTGLPIGHTTSEKNLKIPLKYQRHHHQKHYKKKFRERTWEDYEESIGGGGVAENDASTLHKSSKFRPKGKDWDWRADYCRNKGHDADAAPA